MKLEVVKKKMVKTKIKNLHVKLSTCPENTVCLVKMTSTKKKNTFMSDGLVSFIASFLVPILYFRAFISGMRCFGDRVFPSSPCGAIDKVPFSQGLCVRDSASTAFSL